MPSLQDHAHRLTHTLKQSVRYSGPPVLIESAQPNKPVVIRPPREEDDAVTTRRWVRGMFEERTRTEPIMALVDLVAPASRVFELTHRVGHGHGRIGIGRDRDNDVVLFDDTISSHHASIEIHDQGGVLRDRDSRNGTFVNQRKLAGGEVAILHSGDCVRFGQRVFYYLAGGRMALFLQLWLESQPRRPSTGKVR